jgi:hypothetical protein
VTQTTISTGAPLATLFNVFTVDPHRQQVPINLPDYATEEVMRTC